MDQMARNYVENRHKAHTWRRQLLHDCLRDAGSSFAGILMHCYPVMVTGRTDVLGDGRAVVGRSLEPEAEVRTLYHLSPACAVGVYRHPS